MLFTDLALIRAAQMAWLTWTLGMVQLATQSQSQLTYNQR